MGKKMTGTNEFAFFRCKSICTGGGPESGRKKIEKCLPAGTGTKIYFSRHRPGERHIDCYRTPSAIESAIGTRYLIPSLDRGQSRKIRFSKFPGSGLKKI